MICTEMDCNKETDDTNLGYSHVSFALDMDKPLLVYPSLDFFKAWIYTTF